MVVPPNLLLGLLTAALSLAERIFPVLLAWRQGRLSSALEKKNVENRSLQQAEQVDRKIDAMSAPIVRDELRRWERD